MRPGWIVFVLCVGVYVAIQYDDPPYKCFAAFDPDPTPFSVSLFDISSIPAMIPIGSLLRCRWHSNPLERIEEELQKVVGQDIAVNSVKRAFSRHTYSSPMVLHLAGDNGVGKTLTMTLLASSLLHNGVESDCFLSVEGELYSGTELVRDLMGEKFLRAILLQLTRCENSVICIDDVQKMDPGIVSRLSPLLEKGFIHDPALGVVKANQAIFIFASDFHEEGLTRSVSYRGLVEMVRMETERYWSGARRLNHLLFEIIPFQALTAQHIQQIVEQRLQEWVANNEHSIRKLCVHQDIIERISLLSMEHYPNHNARGYTTYYNEYIIDPIVEQVVKAAKREKKAWDVKVDMQYLSQDSYRMDISISSY